MLHLSEILLPLPVRGTFTYSIPEDLLNKVGVGYRVIVPFGKKKYYSGVVVSIFDREESGYGFTVKSISCVIDDKPVVSVIQLEFWKWIADYYIANEGDVMNNAFPTLMKITSETYITLNPEFLGDVSDMDESVLTLVDALNNNKRLSINDVSSIVSVKNVYKYIQTLVASGIVELLEEVNNPYRPRIEEFISIDESFRNEKKMNELFDSLQKRAYRQMEFLLAYYKIAGKNANKYPEVSKKAIYDEITPDRAVMNALLKKKVITVTKRKVDRIESTANSYNVDDIVLTDSQQRALNEIKTCFVEKDTVLLHGVTSSGKTEIYFKLIDEAVRKGKQVLLLLPDIVLTTQIVTRTVDCFGHKVGVFHSKFNHNEKVEIWNAVLDNNSDYSKGYSIIVGTRSSIFLPFDNLGLIIVDDEHDYSYKQNDMQPRYNARDCAVFLSSVCHAKVVLGSATPSIESYYNAKIGRYGLVTLQERYGGLLLPEINVVDMKDCIGPGNTRTNYSPQLIDAIKLALSEKRQVLIFQNRRGFALRLECEVCGWVPTCPNCDVALIYHKAFNQLRCHYCGYHTVVPDECPKCHSHSLFMKGYGTEKVEEELQTIFPDAAIRRMDLDTTRRKHAFSDIISQFMLGEIDILVGTQMITKGLDFENVALVGVVNADSLLYYPDFRSFERAFQELMQVSGRAGRKKDRGKVIIQSFSPYHSAIVYTINNDYDKMYQSQIMERMIHKYPPLYRLIEVKMKHRDPRILDETAKTFAFMLRQELGDRVLGPEYDTIPRINNLYIKNILVKIERNATFNFYKSKFVNCYNIFLSKQEFKGISIFIDVDPY